MVSLALVMHSPLGQAFADCAQHVLGAPPDLLVFDVPADAPPDACAQKLQEQLQAKGTQGVLILCDIYGATPFNIARQAARSLTEQGLHVSLVTGTNLCMVLKALTDKQDNPEALSEKVRLGAQKGIVSADCVT